MLVNYKLKRDGTPSRLLKRSKIWEVFQPASEDPSKAVCGVCQAIISRGGGTGKSQCTTNLWKHLENKHGEIFRKLREFKEVVNRPQETTKIPKLLASIANQADNSKVWELFSVNAQDPNIAKCLECETEITRQPEDVSTDLLWYHIMADHPETYARCITETIDVVAMSPTHRRADVWNDFTQHPLDHCKVVCNTCDTVVSRGTSKDRLNTTNMRRHLVGGVHLNVLRTKGLLENVEWKQDQNSNSTTNNSLHDVTGNTVKPAVTENSSNRSFHSEMPSAISNGTTQLQPSDSFGLFSKDNVLSIVRDRKIDMVHTGLLGMALYEQQKRAQCCDFSIIVRYKAPAPLSVRTKAALDNNGIKNHNAPQMVDITEEFRIHRCIAVIVSENLRSAIELGSDKLTLIDVSKDLMPHFIEIMYTGKLEKTENLKKNQLQELYDLAHLLSAPSVIEYMKREHPKVTMKTNVNFSNPISQPYILKDGNPKPSTTHPVPGENETPLEAELSDKNISSIQSDDFGGGESGSDTNASAPKANKRKNYTPVLNDAGRKKIKSDDGQLSPEPSRTERNTPSPTVFVDQNEAKVE